jgi:hypothetical protein
MNRDRFVAANWRLPLMSDHRTPAYALHADRSQATAFRQGPGAPTFPLTMKSILPITGRLFAAAFGVHALACNWAMRLILPGANR